MRSIAPASRQQKAHYESIHAEYARHYYDALSLEYRRRFITDPLLEGLDLADKDVADLASGSGYNSLAILERFPTARVSGFDISAAACEAYRTITHRPSREIDLTASAGPAAAFDAAVIVGGLHHCVADLPSAIRNVATMLRPGGLLLMVEPNREFWLQRSRALWYRLDKYFDAATEDALSHDQLAALGRPDFDVLDVRYLGGPGYFLILNSLLFRMPLVLKKALAPPLMRIDAAVGRLKSRRLFPYFVARWIKRGTSA